MEEYLKNRCTAFTAGLSSLTFPMDVRFSIRTKTLEVKVALKEFQDLQTVRSYCNSCPNYGKKWSCPPFGQKEDILFENFRQIHIIRLRMDSQSPISHPISIHEAVRKPLDQFLLQLEKENGGYSLLPGCCMACPLECQRAISKPCLHPDLCRPSLEAIGFNVELLCQELFQHGLEISPQPQTLHWIGAFLQ